MIINQTTASTPFSSNTARTQATPSANGQTNTVASTQAVETESQEKKTDYAALLALMIENVHNFRPADETEEEKTQEELEAELRKLGDSDDSEQDQSSVGEIPARFRALLSDQDLSPADIEERLRMMKLPDELSDDELAAADSDEQQQERVDQQIEQNIDNRLANSQDAELSTMISSQPPQTTSLLQQIEQSRQSLLGDPIEPYER
ncbi:hypothetical protein [Marinobacterium arenosum]|uniref:hypothetical protein n=1 Tax=Marinobacterium arenosum TaxID=2862496 RepID=UPI001C96EBB5|nr:hypothetical protein [Marinobacterium arenosum]MBY4678269.1 hypothetical protein [Marinobacterium arenosum]